MPAIPQTSFQLIPLTINLCRKPRWIPQLVAFRRFFGLWLLLVIPVANTQYQWEKKHENRYGTRTDAFDRYLFCC